METALHHQSLGLIGLVLFFGLFIPQILQRFHLPSTTSLILAGFIVGPNGLNYVQPDHTIKLFAFLGATFHMLLAGFEAEKLNIKVSDHSLWKMLGLNGLLPGILGVGVTRYFGYSWLQSFVMGSIFLSTSIMLVFSFSRHLGITRRRVGKLLQSAAIVQDLVGTLLFFLIFQSVNPPSRFPLPILLGLLICSIVLFRMFLPEFVTFVFQKLEAQKDNKEGKLRLILAVLMGTIIMYASVGVHPIVGAFLVGFSLAVLPNTESTKEKLRTMGYGVFIPIFLFTMGTESNLSLLIEMPQAGKVVLIIAACAFLSKLVTGFLGARWVGLDQQEALSYGMASTAKLSVSLTAIYTAFEAKIVDQQLFTAVLIVAVFSSVVTPLVLNAIRWMEARAA